MDEVGDLLGDGRLAGLEAGGEAGDATHDSVVAGHDDDALGGALDGVGGEEGEVLGLEGVLVRVLRAPGLWLRFASQRRVVNLNN